MLSSPPGFVAIFRPKTVSVVQTQRTTIYFTAFIINNNSSTTQIKHLNLDCKSLTETVTPDPRSLSALILPTSSDLPSTSLYILSGVSGREAGLLAGCNWRGTPPRGGAPAPPPEGWVKDPPPTA